MIFATKVIRPGKLTNSDKSELSKFQKSHNLQSDGKYGTQTHNFMFSYMQSMQTVIIKAESSLKLQSKYTIAAATIAAIVSFLIGLMLGN